MTTQEAKQAVEMWLGTAFTNEERHIRRIKKIENYD
jgi:ribose 5-phosphate isomerase RpiB